LSKGGREREYWQRWGLFPLLVSGAIFLERTLRRRRALRQETTPHDADRVNLPEVSAVQGEREKEGKAQNQHRVVLSMEDYRRKSPGQEKGNGKLNTVRVAALGRSEKRRPQINRSPSRQERKVEGTELLDRGPRPFKRVCQNQLQKECNVVQNAREPETRRLEDR